MPNSKVRVKRYARWRQHHAEHARQRHVRDGQLRPESCVLRCIELGRNRLDEFDQTVVEVAGHTDSTGSHAYNQSLSERRSASVASYLKGRGVISERLITVGMGENYPIADNSTSEGRQVNRRVEITMVPLTEG